MLCKNLFGASFYSNVSIMSGYKEDVWACTSGYCAVKRLQCAEVCASGSLGVNALSRFIPGLASFLGGAFIRIDKASLRGWPAR